MKLFIFIFLLVSATNIIATPQDVGNIWHDKKASYQLTLTLPKVSINDFASFAHTKYLLPVAFDTGIKAFNKIGKEIPVFYDESKRTILIPGSNQKEDIFLYFGFLPKDSFPIPIIDKKNHTNNLLTLQEVSWWRTAPNFLTFLTDTINRIKKSNKSSYETLLKQLNYYLNGVFALPPSQKIQMQNHVWEVNARSLANKSYSYRKNLYNSSLVANEWKLLQSDNLRALFPDKHLYKYRFINETNSFLKRTTYYQKEWQKQLNLGREKAIFTPIKDNFDKKHKQQPHYPEQISLITREWDLSGIPVLRFQGNFYTDKKTTYTLKVITNSLWFLELNGKIVLHHEFDPRSAKDMVKKHTTIKTFTLEKGLTPFKFYYYRNNSAMDLVVKIKTPNGNFQELNEHLLSSALPATVKEIKNVSGKLYPIITRNRLHTIMTSKQSYLYLENLSFPKDTKFFYQNKDLNLSNNPTLSALSSSWNKDFTFTYNGKSYHLPAVLQAGRPAISKGVIDFKLEAYPVKYQDEKVSFNLTIENSLTSTLPLLLKVNFFNLQKELLFTETKDITSIPGNQLTNYQMPNSLTNNLPPNFIVETELLVFGLSWGKQSLMFLSSSQLNNKLTLSNNKFITQDQTPVIINLKRMALKDLRNWQLPKLLSFLSKDKTLLLGSINNNKLLKSLTKNNHFTLLNFENSGIQIESGLLNTLIILNEKMAQEKYSHIIITPPLNEIPYLGKELFFKYLSLLYETLINSSYTKKIQLVIPSNATLEYEHYLHKQAREYGLEIITKEIQRKLEEK